MKNSQEKNISNLNKFKIQENFKSVYRKIFYSWMEILKKELSGCSTILDLGCGHNSPIRYLTFNNVSFSVGVDIFEPYL